MARYRSFDGLRLATAPEPPSIDSVRLRRAGLRAAMGDVEAALAAPVPGRVDEWMRGVRAALRVLNDVWTRHVVETEAPGAFLDELVTESPRLANQVKRLRAEHAEILSTLLRVEDALRAPEPEELRGELTGLLSALARHRQTGADLVYEAFDVDLGGG